MPKRLFSLEPLSVPEVSSSALVDVAADAGYEYFSMFAYSPTNELGPDEAVGDPETRRAMKARMRERGVKLLNLECFNLTPDVDPADFEAALECGSDLGAAHATAIVWENADRDDALSKFRRLCDMAAEHRIRINLEFFISCRSIPNLDSAVAFVKDAGRPNSGITMDLLHIIRTSGGLPGLKGFDPAMVGTVQICDGPLDATGLDLGAEMLNRGVPGTGEFPIRDYVEWLPDDAVIGLEVAQMPLFGKTPPVDRARRMIDSTRDLLGR